jgi:hypothetical protein
VSQASFNDWNNNVRELTLKSTILDS